MFFIEYGYISNVDTMLSEDNTTITFTCHLACQTDFITGCNITLMSGCGEEITRSCTVNNTQTFIPRQCSVMFEKLLPTNYTYTASAQSNVQLQSEENILSMNGSLITAGMSLHMYTCTLIVFYDVIVSKYTYQYIT